MRGVHRFGGMTRRTIFHILEGRACFYEELDTEEEEQGVNAGGLLLCLRVGHAALLYAHLFGDALYFSGLCVFTFTK